MSKQMKAHIEDSIMNLLWWQLSVIQGTDHTGHPSSKPVVQSIKFTYKTKKNDPFLEKMISGKMTDFMKFVISPTAINSKSTRIRIQDVYVKVYQENFDGVNNRPMTTYIEATFATLIVNDVVMDVKNWNVTDPYPSTVKPTVINQDKDPKITTIDWLNPATNQKIKEITYDEKLSLQIEIRDAVGGTATIVIKKEDGNDFEQGKTELTFTEAVDESGIVTVAPFLIERIWEDNKTDKYNYLIAQVTYNEITKTSNEIKLIPFLQVVDYKLDKITGKITRVDPNGSSEVSLSDRLFTTDKDGNVDTSKDPLVIDKADPNDNTIISDFANNDKVIKTDLDGKKVTVSFAQTKSGDNAVALFKFASDNTDVEFGIGERDGTFTVTTSGLSVQLFKPNQIGLKKQRRFMHTHDKSVNPSVNDKNNTTYQNFLYIRETKRLIRFDKKGKFGENRKGKTVKNAKGLKNKFLKIRNRNN